MGTIVRASCCKCGFEKEVFFGGGMSDFTTKCRVPAIETKTGKFVVKNYFKKVQLEGDFVFYDEPRMYEGNIEDGAEKWGEVSLKFKNNLCPYCRTFTLNFESIGLYD